MISFFEKKYYEEFLNEFNEISENIIITKLNDKYIVPRLLNRSYIKHYIDKNFVPKKIDNITFNGKLKENQIKIVNKIKDIYDQNNKINGIIKANPGFGKTVISTYLTCLFKKRTLIILDNSKLKEQWIDAYTKFTNLKEEDIGIIIGKVFNPKDVTITMVQTLVSKSKNNFKEYYYKIRDMGFDLVIYDEMHKTISTNNFGKSSLFINTNNIIGLTATPYGDNIHKFLMKNIIGDIILDASQYESIPEIYFVKYKSQIVNLERRLNNINNYIKKIGFYNKIIHNSESYLNTITSICIKLYNTNRLTIIIVFTINQMNAIIDKLNSFNIKATALYSKNQEIDKINDKFIVATYKYASHGFDHPELSCLILATPLSGKISLIQTIGRILRKKENKNNPIVFDLIDLDGGRLFYNMIETKKSILKKEFNIQNFKIYESFN